MAAMIFFAFTPNPLSSGIAPLSHGTITKQIVSFTHYLHVSPQHTYAHE
jgi:hypothetical protein